MPIFGLYMQKIYADKQLGYNENAIFDVPDGYDPCSFVGDALEPDANEIDEIYEYANDHGYRFLCLTASTEKAIKHWQDITGAEYPFYVTDETTLKTIVRSNPGLLLLKDGTIIRKWGHNDMPSSQQLQAPLAKLEIGHRPDDSVGKTLTQVLLWFFMPLFILVFADRMWAWTKFVKRKIRERKELLIAEEEKLENLSADKVYEQMEEQDCNVEMKLYDGARHELINELNKDEVYKDISDFLLDIMGEKETEG